MKKAITLDGINIVCKKPELGFIFPMYDRDWDRMKRWQVNLVRLGINWSGLEPVAGVIDEYFR
ncbi:MAG: hypothetical protein IKR59_04625 [Lachnospiraceae bacterium]|nr:hypothetical protein [Lachnospiraceae bacterium]